jgi:hypothetical protein
MVRAFFSKPMTANMGPLLAKLLIGSEHDFVEIPASAHQPAQDHAEANVIVTWPDV